MALEDAREEDVADDPEGLPAHLRELAQRLAIRPSAVRTLYQEMAQLRAIVERRDAAARLPDVPLTVITRAPGDGESPGTARERLMAELWQQMQAELATGTPRGVLVAASGSGHYVHLDRPELVVQAIREMVEQARLTAASPAAAARSAGRVDIRSAAR